MAYRLGMDVGGTFTDLLLFSDAGGRAWLHKTPSTPHDSSVGVITGVKAVSEQAGIAARQIDLFLHGTTVANAAVRPIVGTTWSICAAVCVNWARRAASRCCALTAV